MGRKICVMGSYITDLTARTPHLPAPGETVLGSQFTIGPGGKGGNQAVAAKRAGGDVAFVTKLGADPFGMLAVDFLKKEGIYSPTVFTTDAHPTGTALIAVDDRNENNIVVVPGACAQLTAQEIGQCEETLGECALLLVQLEANLDATAQMVELAKRAGVQVVLNPAPARSLNGEFLAQVDIITPNESEAELLTGQRVSSLEECGRAAQSFFRQGVKKVVITLGGKGAYCGDGTREALLPPYPAKVVDTTGAGDAFNGGLVKALADGKDFFEAAAYACVVAGLSVQKFGTAPSMPTEEEIAAGLERYRQAGGEK
ncbi:Ribokinase [uncultured Eubacteriales bacterium]|uniref:Ribokinase n=1 Tax=uncultured Eubacteriales bacterium TaxID=172733 RepID=A0A212JA02_9FIRM|nr:Ribokinase [uncultured Eubacteriales bacterium]